MGWISRRRSATRPAPVPCADFKVWLRPCLVNRRSTEAPYGSETIRETEPTLIPPTRPRPVAPRPVRPASRCARPPPRGLHRRRASCRSSRTRGNLRTGEASRRRHCGARSAAAGRPSSAVSCPVCRGCLIVAVGRHLARRFRGRGPEALFGDVAQRDEPRPGRLAQDGNVCKAPARAGPDDAPPEQGVIRFARGRRLRRARRRRTPGRPPWRRPQPLRTICGTASGQSLSVLREVWPWPLYRQPARGARAATPCSATPRRGPIVGRRGVPIRYGRALSQASARCFGVSVHRARGLRGCRGRRDCGSICPRAKSAWPRVSISARISRRVWRGATPVHSQSAVRLRKDA